MMMTFISESAIHWLLYN